MYTLLIVVEIYELKVDRYTYVDTLTVVDAAKLLTKQTGVHVIVEILVIFLFGWHGEQSILFL